MTLNEIIEGDALTILKTMPDKIVQTCITSPPYWGLRDYKIEGQLGLEKTPEKYIAKIVAIFHELRRILRDDGTLWLNMGDSYCHDRFTNKMDGTFEGTDGLYSRKFQYMDGCSSSGPKRSGGQYKVKDMMGIPWRVATALQADGWWLRSDIIWSKPNPMPESCTDRPTRSHEYIFLLTKSGTSQYWTHRDLNGIRKRPKADYRWIDDITKEETDVKPDGWTIKNKMGWNRVNLWQGHDYYYDADAVRMKPTGRTDPIRSLGRYSKQGGEYQLDATVGRNLRTVWTISTQPFPEAHFATFPEELVRRCILAGTAEQACPTCGAAWERVTEKKRLSRPELDPDDPRYRPNRYEGAHGEFRGEMGADCGYTESKTLGFRPTCKCENNDGSGRCIALDPFGGSGTIALVALKHGRDHLTIELKPEYIKMIEKRLKPLGNRPCPQQVEIIT